MKISIVTVSYNAASTIESTLRSVASQDYHDVEHIVIDGESKDDTLEIVERWGKHVARVVSEPDRGIYDAMNKGIALATGDVIGFLNADDFYASNDVITKIVAAFGDPSVGSCHGDLCYVDRNDVKRVVRYWRSSKFVERAFERGWAPPHPTFFVRKSIYEQCGGYRLDLRVAADVELMARFLEIKKIKSVYISKILVKMRMGGVSNRSIAGVIRQNLEVRDALRGLGLDFSLIKFIPAKLFSRLSQFLRKPT